MGRFPAQGTGGNGGAPFIPETQFIDNAILQEEFIANNADFFKNNLYQTHQGVFSLGGSPDDLHGVLTMNVGTAIAGESASLFSGPYGTGGFGCQLAGSGIERDLEFVQVVTDIAGNFGLANTMAFWCLNNKNPGNGHTNKTSWLTFNSIRAIGFYVDPGVDGFFHIFSTDGTTITESATTVAVADFTRFVLSFSYKTANGTATFFIDGVQVGTISTNIARFELANYSAVYNTTTTQVEMTLDAWYVSNARS